MNQSLLYDLVFPPMDMNGLKEVYCLYSHRLPDPTGAKPPQLMFLGVCKLTELFFAPDARRNSSWQEFCDKRKDVQVQVLMITPAQHIAHNERYKMLKLTPAYCNTHGHELGGRSPVICIETGAVFETASEACDVYGISPPSLSNHLAGKVGYRTVKGMTFKRGRTL